MVGGELGITKICPHYTHKGARREKEPSLWSCEGAAICCSAQDVAGEGTEQSSCPRAAQCSPGSRGAGFSWDLVGLRCLRGPGYLLGGSAAPGAVCLPVLPRHAAA